MDTTCTPRIKRTHLESYIGRSVMVVGRVTQLRGESAIIDADGPVTAVLNREAHLTVGNAVQIIGKVHTDMTIRAMHATDVGSDVDIDLCNTVAQIAQQHKELFEPESNGDHRMTM